MGLLSFAAGARTERGLGGLPEIWYVPFLLDPPPPCHPFLLPSDHFCPAPLPLSCSGECDKVWQTGVHCCFLPPPKWPLCRLSVTFLQQWNSVLLLQHALVSSLILHRIWVLDLLIVIKISRQSRNNFYLGLVSEIVFSLFKLFLHYYNLQLKGKTPVQCFHDTQRDIFKGGYSL